MVPLSPDGQIRGCRLGIGTKDQFRSLCISGVRPGRDWTVEASLLCDHARAAKCCRQSDRIEVGMEGDIFKYEGYSQGYLAPQG